MSKKAKPIANKAVFSVAIPMGNQLIPIMNKALKFGGRLTPACPFWSEIRKMTIPMIKDMVSKARIPGGTGFRGIS